MATFNTQLELALSPEERVTTGRIGGSVAELLGAVLTAWLQGEAKRLVLLDTSVRRRRYETASTPVRTEVDTLYSQIDAKLAP